MELSAMATRKAGGVFLGLVVFAAAGCTRPEGQGGVGSPPSSALAAGKPLAITRVKSKGGAMVVSSSVFAEGGPIPDIYTAYGKGYPLPVMWTPVQGAKSYVVAIEDPDAPGPAPFVHWVVYDIPLTVTSLDDQSQGATLPAGARQGVSTAGSAAYFPLKPPVGDKPHRYFVEVFALDTTPQPAGAPDLPTIERAMAGHVLADGVAVGVYQASGAAPS
jgi:Raf kinase inhibitor-like YbhB/YbcL family protein